MRREQPTQYTDYCFEGIDLLVLVIGQFSKQPFACVGQLGNQVYDYYSIKTIDDNLSQALGAHLRACFRNWVELILA
jgi:hypothetical protein